MLRAVVVAIVALAAAPAGASAANIIGSPLTRGGDDPGFCTGAGPGTRCTIVQLTLGTRSQAVPADGVITRWAVRDAGGELALRVIGGSPGQRIVVASAPAVQVVGTGVQGFGVQLPVAAGQYIGLELGENGNVPFFYRDEQTTGELFDPPLGITPSAPVPGVALERTYEALFQATVEPDVDRDGFGDETQDPDRGGAAPPTTPTQPTGPGPASCPTNNVVASGAGSVVYRNGRRLVGCRDGARTTIGTANARTKFRLFRFTDDKLALVKVTRGRSSILVFNLSERQRLFSTSRTFVRVTPERWKVTDLVVAPNSDAAWISTLRGAPDQTTVFIRSGGRIQNIDSGRIRPTSLTLAEGGTGINYRGADGGNRNSSFG